MSILSPADRTAPIAVSKDKKDCRGSLGFSIILVMTLLKVDENLIISPTFIKLLL